MTDDPNNPPPGGSGLLRVRHGHGKVGYIELFFDLVFVYAITCLSHALLHHYTPLGALETLMLMLAVWWVWIYTSWVTNWLDPEKLPVRIVLLALMLGGLVLSTSIDRAFGEKGLIFAGAFVLCQVGRSAFFIWAVRGHPVMVVNFQRILLWSAFSGVFWITGAFFEGHLRLLIWAAALVVEYSAPSLGYHVPGLGKSRTKDWEVEGGHFSERCALFIIIALGETIMLTGALFNDLAWTPANLSAFVVSFIGTVVMWWLYFDTAAEAGSRRISHSDDPGRMARLAYTYIHLFLVAGIILAAVADEFVLHHPMGHTSAGTAIAVLGSVGLYLLGNLLFKRTVAGRYPLSHLIGIAALGGISPFALHIPPVFLSAYATLVMTLIAAWEHHSGCLRDDLAEAEH